MMFQSNLTVSHTSLTFAPLQMKQIIELNKLFKKNNCSACGVKNKIISIPYSLHSLFERLYELVPHNKQN